MPEELNGRNSPLRTLLKYPVDLVVDGLNKLGFTADQITYFGLFGNTVSSIIVTKDVQKHKSERNHWFVNMLILVLPSLLDFLDGSLARKQGTCNPHLDVASDRISEIVATSAIAITNPDAKNAAIANQITSVGPSVAKAYAEKQGVIVPELEPASYPVRVATIIAATVFPEHASDILWLQTAANVFTTVKRFGITTSYKVEPRLSHEDQVKSGKRLNLLLGMTALSIVTAIAVNQITKFPQHSEQ